MLVRRFQVSIAVMLPLSFLWLMMACVTGCERQSEREAQFASCSAETLETELVTQQSSCPFGSLPDATVPEGSAIKMKLPATAFAIATIAVRTQGATIRHNSFRLLPEAILERCSVLRI